jgi:NADPH2:quinone reductase
MDARAARLIEHGKPLEVQDLELRQPGAHDVVVDMAFAGVNPIDRYGALGRVAPDAPIPRTLGSEGAGTVGDRRVMVRGHGLGTALDGLWSTRAVVPDDALIDLPESVGLDVAAAMGVAGVTAWRTVTEKAKVTADDRVLVLGASGGVGSIVVSVAKNLGATVWGQTGNPDKAGWVRDRGADHVVVADADHLAEAADALQPTVVFDPLGGSFFGAGVEALARRGRLVLFGTSAGPTGEVPLQQLYRKGVTILGYGGLIEPDDVMAAHIADAVRAVADGRMEVVIDRAVPLDDVQDAFSLLEQRSVRGKLLVDLRH